MARQYVRAIYRVPRPGGDADMARRRVAAMIRLPHRGAEQNPVTYLVVGVE
jgi:hypothetical protein